MDWNELFWQALSALIATVLLPLAGVMVQRYIKDARLAQFATGAIAAAGRVAIVVESARQRSPAAPLTGLVDNAVRDEVGQFLAAYSGTAAALGADSSDATSRIKGEVGKLLAPAASITQADAAVHVGAGRQ